jgi:hypothetical protein
MLIFTHNIRYETSFCVEEVMIGRWVNYVLRHELSSYTWVEIPVLFFTKHLYCSNRCPCLYPPPTAHLTHYSLLSFSSSPNHPIISIFYTIPVLSISGLRHWD